MKEKEAIERLKDHFRIHDDGIPTPYLDEAANMAVKALEKQVAKSPNWVADFFGDTHLVCPSCGKGAIANIFHREPHLYPFCPWCGQKLESGEAEQ